MNANTYHTEVKRLAQECFNTVMQQNGNDLETCKDDGLFNDWLHNTLEGHEFVIYNHNHLSVLDHAYNPEALLDLHGSEYAGDILANNGLFALHSALAFYAMLEEASEVLEDLIIDWELENDA